MNAKAASLIPLKVLFGHPIRYVPLISPDGKSIAYAAPHEGTMYLWLRDLKTGSDKPLTEWDGWQFFHLHWAHNSRQLLYMQDEEGNEDWDVFVIDIESLQARDLTPFPGVKAQFIAASPRNPDKVLIELNKEDPTLFDAYLLDLNSGDLELVAKNPGNVSPPQLDRPSWFADLDLEIRARASSHPDGSYSLEVRDPEGEWQEARRWDFEDSRNSRPVGMSADGRFLYCIDSYHSNTGRLTVCDLESMEFEVLFEDPEYDLEIVLLHPVTRTPQAVGYDGDRLTWKVLDASIAGDFDVLREDSSADFSVISRDDADRTWVVTKYASDAPTSFYLYDRDTKELSFLWASREDLRDFPLASMEPYSFTSRDGLMIHGYISLPLAANRQSLPTVLFPHGGPWERDVWALNPVVQFLANRGYAVLQVNFRGSTGYGKDFVNAGNREWGGKMHDDLIDAVNWAIDQGYADPERVAIFGGSYGGYAALVGATFTPEVFCCVIDLFGWSDLVTAQKTLPPDWKRIESQRFRRVGDPYTEADFLWSRSPLSRVDQILSPLLIVHGANDVRVPKKASDQIVGVLKEKGIPHKYLVFDDEGHVFSKPENLVTCYEAVEEFLAEHL